jgi:hypothetical protein
MKRLFSLSLIFILASYLYAQSNGVWNSRTCTYTNAKHQTTWKLFDDFSWVERPILANSTLLKVRCDDLNVLVTIQANKGVVSDQWEWVSFVGEEYKKVQKSEANRTGMILQNAKTERCYFCDMHALKSRSEMKKNYPNQVVYSIHESYQIVKRGYLYTLNVTILSILEEEKELFDEISSELFKGFSIK